MGLFDFLGPTSWTKRRGWDYLPAATETRAVPAVRPLVTLGPGQVFYDASAARALTSDGAATNSAVQACLGVLAESVVEPDLATYRPGPKGGADRVAASLPPLDALLARPNPQLSFKQILAYTTVCLSTDGNAYWRKIRSGDPTRGNVVQLWPLAPDRVAPYTRSGSDDFITAYRWYGQGAEQAIDPANVVHFRYGLDPADHRLGYAPLRRLLAEVMADEQATRYAARLLANLAINGLTLSFDKDAPSIDQATADELKARIAAAYGGDNVGATAVLSPGATLTAMGFSPEQMDMRTLHRIPEERISAVLGVPAIVAGLGAGLDRSTFANFKEAREAFTETRLIPLWAMLAETITLGLVPDFTSDASIVVDFDTTTVRALQEDQDALATRLATLVAAGILTEDEARAAIGYGPKPTASVTIPPAATRSARPRLLPVPENKAIEDIVDEYARLVGRRLPAWERELVAFFADQAERVAGRLADGATTARALVPDGETMRLASTLAPLQVAMLDDMASIVVAELAVGFVIDDPETRAYLRACGEHIAGITETTRAAVRAALAEGHAAGEGISELARRLLGLPAFDAPRARVCARTELGTSQNLAALSSYRASGVVVGVRVLDGDFDEACQAMNGRAFALDHAPPPLQHPNCTRSFLPLTSADELTRSA